MVEQIKKQREKITLDTPEPQIPKKKIPAPSRKEHEEKVSQLESQIQNLKDSLGQAYANIQSRKQAGKQDPSSKTDLFNNITEKRRLHEQKEKLRVELESLRDIFRKGVEENKKIRPKLKYTNDKEIDKAIQDLHRKIETTSIGLQEEKKLLNLLKELEAAKPLCQEFNARNIQLNANKQRQEEIRTQIDEIWKKIEAIQGQITNKQETMQSQHEKQQSEFPNLLKQKEEVQNQISELYEQKKKIQQEYREKEAAYKEYQNLVKRREFIIEQKKRIREREERRKKYEEEQRELEGLNPW